MAVDQRSGSDRRQFLRRFADLGAQLEALQGSDRERIMAYQRRRIAEMEARA